MSADAPFNVYRDQLASLSLGIALWNPNPQKTIYNNVSIGDVGYLQEGTFIRMFNVMLPWGHPSNQTLGDPERFASLDCGRFHNTLDVNFNRVEHNSRFVSTETNADNIHARAPDDAEGVTYKSLNRGALLSLPNGGHRKDVIRRKAFEDYIRSHVVSWFTWTQNNQLGVERMEDLILVTGCTLVTSWAAAVFVEDNMETEVSLASRILSNVGASFVWSKIRGPAVYHNSHFDPQNPLTTPDQCVFIKGFRAKRTFFRIRHLRAAAEPLPDDPDNHGDDEIQVSGVPDVQKYRDPLIGVLDYIAEKCLELKDAIPEDTIAIAHEDDLQLIEDVETLTADAVEKFLREKQMPLLVKEGAAILRAPGNAISTLPSISTWHFDFVSIFNTALETYKRRTKNDLTSHPLLPIFQSCESPEAVLTVFRDQIPAFGQSQSGDDGLIKWVTPTVNVLYAFSATIGQGNGITSRPASEIFVGIGVLLLAAEDASAVQKRLIVFFYHVERFFRRLENYTDITPTADMKHTITEIMVEVLTFLAFATKEVKRGRLKRGFKKLIGNIDIEASLHKLDLLTNEEGAAKCYAQRR